MPVTRIHSFLTYPAKNEPEQPGISGTELPHAGGLWLMLNDVFDRAPAECTTEIVFSPSAGGEQENSCRDCLEQHLRSPSVESGREVAGRLQRVTTHRSGLGLLFLLCGTDPNGRHAFVISRFPADQGVVAQEDLLSLSVEFLERVFMKNSRSYKSVLYSTDSLAAGFAQGRAVDRQAPGSSDMPDYWIRSFLQSELKTTSLAGSRTLAQALRGAVRSAPDLGVKQELIAIASLIRGQHGRVISGGDLLLRFGVSEVATNLIKQELRRPELLDQRFELDAVEFARHAKYKSVEMSSGAMLTAEEKDFDQVFERELLVAENVVKYSTTGQVVDESLRQRP